MVDFPNDHKWFIIGRKGMLLNAFTAWFDIAIAAELHGSG
jgi:hypothetical protein